MRTVSADLGGDAREVTSLIAVDLECDQKRARQKEYIEAMEYVQNAEFFPGSK